MQVTVSAKFFRKKKKMANANRYTFVWCGSINYHLAGLLDAIDSITASAADSLNISEDKVVILRAVIEFKVCWDFEKFIF